MLFQFVNGNDRVLRIASPAKLNLFLEIHGRRVDGFHELQSVMSKFSLYDHLTFTANQTGEIDLAVESGNPVSVSMIPDNESNLVCQALTAMRSIARQRTDRPMGMRVQLFKNIPVQAGLGGASGNAAAAIVAANLLWKLELPMSRLMAIGGQLGSDVPFFLGSGFCKCTGKGDQIENLNYSRRLNVLVAKPEFGLSTPEIYSRCRVPEDPINIRGFVDALISGQLARIGKSLFNRLESVAEEIQEGIARLRYEFSRTVCLGAAMTGSGSCYFGIYSNRRVMMAAARTLASRLPHVQWFDGHTLTNAFYSRPMAVD